MDTMVEAGTSSVDQTQLLQVGPEILSQAWVLAKPLLEKVWDRYDMYISLDDLYFMLLNQRMQLWMANTVGDEKNFFVAATVELIDFPQVRLCKISYLGGDELQKIVPFISSIEDWAVSQGATRIEIDGREGWHHVMKPLGYTRAKITLCKSLKERVMH